jgi:hypothetical protein
MKTFLLFVKLLYLIIEVNYFPRSMRKAIWLLMLLFGEFLKIFPVYVLVTWRIGGYFMSFKTYQIAPLYYHQFGGLLLGDDKSRINCLQKPLHNGFIYYHW